ncbi:MAG: glycoside hydrolase family 3 protein [Clostridia bacterium]|nr:glycoside hydrolase family 3 protein [Clostridia bacterium]
MSSNVFSAEAFAAKAREVVAEGCVLLHNDGGVLPLKKGCRIAVFGRTQMNYFKSGLGSGGLVNARYVTGIYAALRDSGNYVIDRDVRDSYERWTEEHPFDIGDGWANHPWYQQEMPLDESFVSAAASRNDVGIVIIGRTAGEDRDNVRKPGSWMLTGEEESMLELVCRCFERSVVLLNTGNIIDMTWVERYRPSSVMYVWQGGQEGGNGVADVIGGMVSPCGRLTDTIARSVEDYPSDNGFGDEKSCVYCEDIYVGYRYFESFAKDSVLYHFGEGGSYTTFLHQPISMMWDGENAVIHHRVKNTGDYASKEVVQIYVKQPQGKLGKPELVLCGFAKTQTLQPGEQEDVTVKIPADRIVSYDDCGATGHRSCYVLEAGRYHFLAGHSVRCLKEVGSFDQPETMVTAQLEQACALTQSFERLHPIDGKIAYELVTVRSVHPSERRSQRLPDEICQTEYRGLKLEDVAAGRCTMDEFVAQMTDDDLCCIVRGEGMSSPRVTPGTAGAVGGVTDRLAEQFGIPAVCCADGPSGIRMDCGNKAFSMPNGTCQACTWNEELICGLYACEGMEMRKYQVDNLLGPGMNIHRHPLNGRNFEYFSEDPLVTGLIASAQLKGMHESGVTGTVKHFSCNNQEQSRRWVDAVVSERALREIYFRGFEIAVKEGNARSVMTSYNPINGCWAASHYDMLTTVLRGEWGFDGIVMTDWWAMGSEEGKEPSVTNVASMVRAQNDLFMVTNDPSANTGDDDSRQSLEQGTVVRAEYQRSAMNICRFVIDTPAFRRSIGLESEDDRQLRQMRDDDGDVILSVPEIYVGENAVIAGSRINTSAGKSSIFQMKLEKRGQYEISVICRAASPIPDTAQLPVSVFVDSHFIGSQVLNGGQKDWQTLKFTTGEIRRRLIFYSKFYFTVGGLEVSEIRIKRIKTFETPED